MRKEKEIPSLTPEDKEFFLNIYLEYSWYMSYTAAKYASNKNDREDMIQETMIRLFRNITTLRALDRSQMTSYIGFTMRAVYIDFLKKESRSIPIDEEKLEYLILEHNEENELEHNFIMFQNLEKIRRELPPRDWYVLEATYLLELTKEEIAQTLGVEPDSIRMILHRARKKAREILSETTGGDK